MMMIIDEDENDDEDEDDDDDIDQWTYRKWNIFQNLFMHENCVCLGKMRLRLVRNYEKKEESLKLSLYGVYVLYLPLTPLRNFKMIRLPKKTFEKV